MNERSSNLLFILAAAIITCLNVASIVLWQHSKSTRQMLNEGAVSNEVPKSLEYGEMVENFRMVTYTGEKVDIPSKKSNFLFVFFFRPESQRHRELLSALDIFAGKVNKEKIRFVCVGLGDLEWLYDSGFNLEQVQIVEDKDLKYGLQLKSDKHTNGSTIVLDNTGKVMFSLRELVSGDLMRQLIQKFEKLEV